LVLLLFLIPIGIIHFHAFLGCNSFLESIGSKSDSKVRLNISLKERVDILDKVLILSLGR
jgi:hypothetical protein